MVRRIASQVHKQASRLLRAQYLKKEPAWFQAVLEHPPLPLPPKAPPPRNEYDSQAKDVSSASLKRMRPHEPRPQPIHYLEDEIRRQFFMDHPFEAFRPRTLIEDGEIEQEHLARGMEWRRLRQRGRNPSSEDAVKYAVNLYDSFQVPLSEAYASAVAQFRALRSEHQTAKNVALMEAEAIGLQFGPSAVDLNYQAEENALQSWTRKDEEDAAAAQAARKRWRAVVERDGNWSRAQEYTRLWQEGVRPDYSPAVHQAVNASRAP